MSTSEEGGKEEGAKKSIGGLDLGKQDDETLPKDAFSIGGRSE